MKKKVLLCCLKGKLETFFIIYFYDFCVVIKAGSHDECERVTKILCDYNEWSSMHQLYLYFEANTYLQEMAHREDVLFRGDSNHTH